MAGRLVRSPKRFLLLSQFIFMTGCAVTILTYESGINFDGNNVTRTGHGDVAILDETAGLKVRANCAKVEERAGVLFPVFPALY